MLFRSLKEFYFPGDGRERSAYFDDYVRRYTDMPMLVMLKEHTLPGGEVVLVPDRYVRASDFNGRLGQANNPEWKTVAFDAQGKVVLPQGAGDVVQNLAVELLTPDACPVVAGPKLCNGARR